MRFARSVSTALAAFAFVATWGAAPQSADAGPACDAAGLNSPCVRSNDLKARLILDQDDTNARLRLKNEDGAKAVELDAGSANVTNLFSNQADESNGLVKAWAQINADGTIDSCWRCNTDTAETQRLNAGQYEVDFTPLGTDISGRPRSAILNNPGAGNPAAGVIALADRSTDPSSIFVGTADTDGVDSDRPFVLIIY
jgi:hypothetical protein